MGRKRGKGKTSGGAAGDSSRGRDGGGGGGAGRQGTAPGGSGGGAGRQGTAPGGSGGGAGVPAKGSSKRLSKKEYAAEDWDPDMYTVARDKLIKDQEVVKEREMARIAANAAADFDKNRFRLDVQVTMDDLHVFHITTRLCGIDWVAHYTERRTYNQANFRFKIPVFVVNEAVEHIPVTTEKESTIKETRHYIVEILRESNQTRFRVLIEEHSGYCVAFQVVILGELPGDVKWCMFADHVGLNAELFDVAKMLYKSAYSSPESIKVDEYAWNSLFVFLESFRFNVEQDPTDEGRIFFDTLFMWLSEAPRFGIVENWITTTQGQIPWGITRIVKVWLKLCKCLFLLYLYLIEKKLADEDEVSDEGLALILQESAEKARLEMAAVQFKIQDCGFYFFPEVLSVTSNNEVQLANGVRLEDVALDEELKRSLCGVDGLHLLRHNPKLCHSILCRLNGYRGLIE